jgi:hypothetical protein
MTHNAFSTLYYSPIIVCSVYNNLDCATAYLSYFRATRNDYCLQIFSNSNYGSIKIKFPTVDIFSDHHCNMYAGSGEYPTDCTLTPTSPDYNPYYYFTEDISSQYSLISAASVSATPSPSLSITSKPSSKSPTVATNVAEIIVKQV